MELRLASAWIIVAWLWSHLQRKIPPVTIKEPPANIISTDCNKKNYLWKINLEILFCILNIIDIKIEHFRSDVLMSKMPKEDSWKRFPPYKAIDIQIYSWYLTICREPGKIRSPNTHLSTDYIIQNLYRWPACKNTKKVATGMTANSTEEGDCLKNNHWSFGK